VTRSTCSCPSLPKQKGCGKKAQGPQQQGDKKSQPKQKGTGKKAQQKQAQQQQQHEQ
jgi:hypothetical protein